MSEIRTPAVRAHSGSQRTVVVKNIPQSMDEKSVRLRFSCFGEIECVLLPNNENVGTVQIVFSHAISAATCKDFLHEKVVMDTTTNFALQVLFPSQLGTQPSRAPARLLVEGLPDLANPQFAFDVERELRSLFSKFDHVVEVRLQAPCAAVVELATLKHAKRAMQTINRTSPEAVLDRPSVLSRSADRIHVSLLN